jgi:hypothetical protein
MNKTPKPKQKANEQDTKMKEALKVKSLTMMAQSFPPLFAMSETPHLPSPKP